MVLDANLLQEKLIEAWKLRSDEASFSASLTPLVAECQSEEEFRIFFTSKTNFQKKHRRRKAFLFFTEQILIHIDSATSSNLLQSYFKFHTRSGYIHEYLVIERLLALSPSTSSIVNDDVKIKFLLELLFDTLKTLNVTAEQAPRLAQQINLLAKWLCSALCVYSTDEFDSTRKELLVLVSNLFLLLFNNSTFYCLWLMTIKAQREQNQWRKYQEELTRLNIDKSNQCEPFEQILFK